VNKRTARPGMLWGFKTFELKGREHKKKKMREYRQNARGRTEQLGRANEK